MVFHRLIVLASQKRLISAQLSIEFRSRQLSKPSNLCCLFLLFCQVFLLARPLIRIILFRMCLTLVVDLSQLVSVFYFRFYTVVSIL